MNPGRKFARAVALACLCLSGSLALPAHSQTGATASDTGLPFFENVRFGGHTLFANPYYMDSEVNGRIRIAGMLDLNGFFGVVPRTFGNGGSHYGELKATLPLLRWRTFTVGPATERVARSAARDRLKAGISGRATLGAASFDWEIFPYTTRGPANVGTFYVIPLWGRWSLDGFWDVLNGGASVGKAYLHYRLSGRLDIMAEYFHNGFLAGADQDRLGVGVAYRFR